MFRPSTVMPIWASVLTGFVCSLAQAQDAARAVRVGIYDNRAIAVAFAASKYNPVAEKMKEYNAAKEAGNTDRVRELEAWGQKLQRQLHRQGFSRVPVDDLLAHVKDQLPEVAEKMKIDVIVWQCDFASPGTEIVDVTSELVQLFHPTEKTLRTIGDLLPKPPIELDVVEQNHEH